jgi:excisionase family DNA binding protein
MTTRDHAHAHAHAHDHDHDHDHGRDPVPLSQRLLLRPEEVAAMLSLGRSTIYELLRSGELSAVHIGRATRIPARDLHRWIEQHSSGSGSGSGSATGTRGASNGTRSAS